MCAPRGTNLTSCLAKFSLQVGGPSALQCAAGPQNREPAGGEGSQANHGASRAGGEGGAHPDGREGGGVVDCSSGSSSGSSSSGRKRSHSTDREHVYSPKAGQKADGRGRLTYLILVLQKKGKKEAKKNLSKVKSRILPVHSLFCKDNFIFMFITCDFIVYAPYYRDLYKLISKLIVKLEISPVLAYLLVVIYAYGLFSVLYHP
jgi:hypothetical protein